MDIRHVPLTRRQCPHVSNPGALGLSVLPRRPMSLSRNAPVESREHVERSSRDHRPCDHLIERPVGTDRDARDELGFHFPSQSRRKWCSSAREEPPEEGEERGQTHGHDEPSALWKLLWRRLSRRTPFVEPNHDSVTRRAQGGRQPRGVPRPEARARAKGHDAGAPPCYGSVHRVPLGVRRARAEIPSRPRHQGPRRSGVASWRSVIDRIHARLLATILSHECGTKLTPSAGSSRQTSGSRSVHPSR